MTRLALVLVTVVTKASLAQAAPAPGVGLSIQGCEALDLGAVRRLTGIELGLPLVDGEGAEGTLALRCEGSSAYLKASTPEGAAYERTVDLSSAPDGGSPRLLALTMAELMDAARARAPNPAPEAPPPPAPLEDVSSPWRVWLFAVMRASWAGTASTWGGSLSLQRDLPWHLAISVDLSADGTRAVLPLGTVNELLLSGAALGWVHLEAGAFRVELGAGMRAGLARFFGDPSDRTLASGGVLQAGWAAPVAGLRFSLALPSSWLLGAEAELGWVTRPLRGNVEGTTVLALEGGWTSVRLGVGRSF